MIDEKKLVKEIKKRWREDDFIPVDRFLEIIECQSKIEGWIPCSEQSPKELRELVIKGRAYDQVAWERDVAISQLEEIGCSFGQKMDEVKEALEKQKVFC